MSQMISPQEALIYVMVTMSAVDRSMDDEELQKIGQIVETLPAFRDFDSEQLVTVSRACGEKLAHESGLDNTLDMIRDALPERLRETAYAMAVEVAAADLHVEQEELRFLQLLRDKLDLDKLSVAAIERSARARFSQI